MALSVGAVYASLGGNFDRAAFDQFGREMYLARTRMEDGEKRIRSSAQRTSASLHAIGHAAKIGAGAGILGLAGVIGVSIKKAADFEAQLSSLQAVTRANAKDMASLRKQAMDMGAATKYSALEAASAQTALAKGGLVTAQILKGGLKAALSLAAAGEMDLTQAAETTVNAMKQFGIDGSKAGHVADALATAANATTVEVSDMAMALQQGGGVSAMAGASFDETVAAIEAMADASIRGSDAGTSLKSFFLNIATPSKQAREAMDKLGLSIFDSKGELKSMPEIAGNLRKSFGDLTKEQFLNRAGIIAGSDAARALFAIYKAGPAGMRSYLVGLKEQGTAAELAAKKQDNLKGKIENLKGSLETSAITIGTHFLPMLTKGAEQATTFINGLAASGQLDSFASDLTDGVVQFGRVAIPILGDFVHTGGDVVGVLGDIAGALDLGDPHKLEAIAAGFVAFKVAGVVAPMIVAVADGLRALSAAQQVGNLGGALAGLATGTGAMKLAIAGVAGAIAYMATQESHDEQVTRRLTAAKRDLKIAIDALNGDELSAAQAHLNVKQAVESEATAHQRVLDLRRQGKTKSQEYRDALAQDRQAHLSTLQAMQSEKDVLAKLEADKAKASSSARKRLQAATDKLPFDPKRGALPYKVAPENALQFRLSNATKAQVDEYNTSLDKLIQTNTRVAVSQTNVTREMNSLNPILAKNRAGVAQLFGLYEDMPAEVKTRLELEDQDTLAKLGRIGRELAGIGMRTTVAKVLARTESAASALVALEAIRAGVNPHTVLKITSTAKTAQDEIDRLKDAIKRLDGNKATINITTNRTEKVSRVEAISQRFGPSLGHPKSFAPAKAAGGRTDGPQMYVVGEGRDPVEWIIPRDPQYRGRAVGLLMDAAKSILPGAATGGKFDSSKPNYKPQPKRSLPGHIDPISLPVDTLSNRVSAAQSAYDKAKQAGETLKTARGSVRDAAKRTPKTAKDKVDKAKDLKQARDKVAALEREHSHISALRKQLTERKRELNAAREYQRRIDRQRTLADNAADQMALADRRGDQGAYTKAHAARDTALKELRRLLASAQKVAGTKTFAEELAGQIGKVDLDLADSADAKSTADQTDSGMTAAERARLAEIDARVSLAALTPDLGDDTDAARNKVTFLESVLAAVQGDLAGRGGYTALSGVADQVKQARDNLASLTGGGSSNDNPDLQAQLDQERERTRTAREEATFNARALAVFQGASDISTGRGMQVTNNFSSLVPASVSQAAEIAGYIVGGIDAQGSRQSSKVVVG